MWKPMEDDCLKIILLIGTATFKYKILKALNYCILILLLFLIIPQSYFFIKIFKTDFFIQYAALYCTSSFALVSIISGLINEDQIVEVLSVLKKSSISLENVNGEIKDTIQKQAKYVQIIGITILSLSFISALLFITIGKDRAGELFYPIVFFAEHLPACAICMYWIYAILITYYGFILIDKLYILMYVVFHLKFQFYILNSYVANLVVDFSDQNIDNERYQTIIYQRLATTAERHNELNKIMNLAKKFTKILVIVYPISGTLLGVSIIFYGVVAIRTVGPTCVTISTITFFLIFFLSIWSVEDLYEAMNDLYNVYNNALWYTWNLKNRKTYWFILMNMSQKHMLSFSDKIQVNYALALNMLRNLYSAVALLVQIKKKY